MAAQRGMLVRVGVSGIRLLTMTAFLLGGVQGARAQNASREDVEAAYLDNFGKFARWPQGADRGPLVLCIAGEQALGEAVARVVKGEVTDGRPVEERNVTGPEGVGGCAVLFVGTAEGEDRFLAAAEGKPVLTVGDAPDFLTRGGMIQFVQTGSRLRFSVNLEACQRHGMNLSSELLKVAVSVLGSRSAGGSK
jgi:hypothetical protein